MLRRTKLFILLTLLVLSVTGTTFNSKLEAASEQKILYVGQKDNGSSSSVFTMNKDGSGKQNLTGETPGSIVTYPQWSPNGQMIGYIEFSPQANHFGIVTMNRDGSNQKLVTPEMGISSDGVNISTSFTWSADSSELYFATYGKGSYASDGTRVYKVSPGQTPSPVQIAHFTPPQGQELRPLIGGYSKLSNKLIVGYMASTGSFTPASSTYRSYRIDTSSEDTPGLLTEGQGALLDMATSPSGSKIAYDIGSFSGTEQQESDANYYHYGVYIQDAGSLSIDEYNESNIASIGAADEAITFTQPWATSEDKLLVQNVGWQDSSPTTWQPKILNTLDSQIQDLTLPEGQKAIYGSFIDNNSKILMNILSGSTLKIVIYDIASGQTTDLTNDDTMIEVYPSISTSSTDEVPNIPPTPPITGSEAWIAVTVVGCLAILCLGSFGLTKLTIKRVSSPSQK